MMYAFMPQFVPLIEDGRKKQTIRVIGKRRHAYVGEMLQLYKNSRQPDMAKIIPDQECTASDPLLLAIEDRFGSVAAWLNDVLVDPMGEFAIADGFLPRDNLGPVSRMWQHFYRQLDAGDHKCQLIKWDEPTGQLL